MTLHRGVIAKPPDIREVRPLSRDDLAILREKRADITIKNLRDTHHRLARLVAMGLRNDELIELSGYTYTRIHQLRHDPAFQELVAQKRKIVDEAFWRQQDEFAALATANMRRAETMLSDKLEAAEESGEFLPTRDLIAITEGRMDRFGYGKTRLNVNVNADFAAKLEAAKARISSARTIDGTTSSLVPSGETRSDHPPAAPDSESPNPPSDTALVRRRSA